MRGIMLHSSYAKKDTYEDNKTSAVFENLMLLPDDVFWLIIRNSCIDASNLPEKAGLLLEYQFWPHWDPKGTNNTGYVEPDVFFRFELFDVIIEAKYAETGGQNAVQWKNEIISYYNEYGDDKKDVFFFAVGGITDRNNVSLEINGKSVQVNNCTWFYLLLSASNYGLKLQKAENADYSVEAQKRIIQNVTLAFNINGVNNLEWFDSMINMDTHIDEKTIKNLEEYFGNY